MRRSRVGSAAWRERVYVRPSCAVTTGTACGIIFSASLGVKSASRIGGETTAQSGLERPAHGVCGRDSTSDGVHHGGRLLLGSGGRTRCLSVAHVPSAFVFTRSQPGREEQTSRARVQLSPRRP